MSNDLIQKNAELGKFLFCERYTLQPVKNSLYIAEGQDLKRGAVVDLNGVLVGTNSLMPYAVLETDCDTRAKGAFASVFVKGEFNFDKLFFADGLSKEELDNIVYNGSGLGIVIKPYEYAEDFSPLMAPSKSNPFMTESETESMINNAVSQVTLDPSEVAFGNVHLLDEATEFKADSCVLVDSDQDGPKFMKAPNLLELTAQNAFNFSKERDFFATKQSLASETARAVARENEIESLFVMPTEEAVAAWLDAHPEATTTVEDWSLTSKKLVVGTLNFVTPEMFGAVGDGITDDYNAFAEMLAGGNKYCLLGQGKTYYVSSSLTYSSNTIIDFNGSTLTSGADGNVFSGVGRGGARLKNVIIRNGSILGNGSDGHVGDQGAGILGWNVDNLQVINMTFSNTFGDGMLFRTCENVIIRDCEITKYGRNGISPISGSFYIEGLKIYGGSLSGANPGLCFDCEPEADEHTKLHIVDCNFTDAYFVDFYTPNDDDDFCIELLMENTKVWSSFNGVRFVSNKNLNAKNVKLVNCDLKITTYESSCIRMLKTSGIVVDSCKFSHSVPLAVNTHCVSVSGDVKNIVLKNVDFTGFPNALFGYEGTFESITLDGVTTSIYAQYLKNSKLLNSKITGFTVRDGHTLSESTGNSAFNSILPVDLRKMCKLGGASGQFFGSALLSNEYVYSQNDFTDEGNTKIIEIPLPAEDVTKGHCYLVSVGYSHRGATSNSGQRIFAIYCGDLGATITDIVNVGDKSISVSYNHTNHSLVVTFAYNYSCSMSWSIFG